LFGGKQRYTELNTINVFGLFPGYEVKKGTLFIKDEAGGVKSDIITNLCTVEVEIGQVLIGNNNNFGVSVPYAIHDGTQWVDK
jgi:hypothetical protein